jgi:hypothetical protein
VGEGHKDPEVNPVIIPYSLDLYVPTITKSGVKLLLYPYRIG